MHQECLLPRAGLWKTVKHKGFSQENEGKYQSGKTSDCSEAKKNLSAEKKNIEGGVY